MKKLLNKFIVIILIQTLFITNNVYGLAVKSPFVGNDWEQAHFAEITLHIEEDHEPPLEAPLHQLKKTINSEINRLNREIASYQAHWTHRWYSIIRSIIFIPYILSHLDGSTALYFALDTLDSYIAKQIQTKEGLSKKQDLASDEQEDLNQDIEAMQDIRWILSFLKFYLSPFLELKFKALSWLTYGALRLFVLIFKDIPASVKPYFYLFAEILRDAPIWQNLYRTYFAPLSDFYKDLDDIKKAYAKITALKEIENPDPADLEKIEAFKKDLHTFVQNYSPCSIANVLCNSTYNSIKPHLTAEVVCNNTEDTACRKNLYQLTVPTTHNSIAIGGVFGNQYLSLTEQFKLGIRGFMLDITSLNDEPVLTHGRFLHYGSLTSAFKELKELLDANPQAIISIFIENVKNKQGLNPRLIENILPCLVQSGLQKYAMVTNAIDWFTLSSDDLLNTSERCLITMQSSPFSFSQTPFQVFGSFEGTCEKLAVISNSGNKRPVILNHFLAWMLGPLSQKINEKSLWDHALNCRKAWLGRKPNFIAVDHVLPGENGKPPSVVALAKCMNGAVSFCRPGYESLANPVIEDDLLCYFVDTFLATQSKADLTALQIFLLSPIETIINGTVIEQNFSKLLSYYRNLSKSIPKDLLDRFIGKYPWLEAFFSQGTFPLAAFVELNKKNELIEHPMFLPKQSCPK